MVTKIISGAQTGADQGGLRAAVKLGLARGGWIPNGRRTDDGPLSLHLFDLWQLVEHPSPQYPPRTELNVIHSDGTLWFGDVNSPGGRLTRKLVLRYNRYWLENPKTVPQIQRWLRENPTITVLNVAGNRERTNPGLGQRVEDALVEALKNLT